MLLREVKPQTVPHVKIIQFCLRAPPIYRLACLRCHVSEHNSCNKALGATLIIYFYGTDVRSTDRLGSQCVSNTPLLRVGEDSFSCYMSTMCDASRSKEGDTYPECSLRRTKKKYQQLNYIISQA